MGENRVDEKKASEIGSVKLVVGDSQTNLSNL